MQFDFKSAQFFLGDGQCRLEVFHQDQLLGHKTGKWTKSITVKERGSPDFAWILANKCEPIPHYPVGVGSKALAVSAARSSTSVPTLSMRRTCEAIQGCTT